MSHYLLQHYVYLPIGMVGILWGMILWGSLMVGENLAMLGGLLTGIVLFIFYGSQIPLELFLGISPYHSRFSRLVRVRQGILTVDMPWYRHHYRLSDCRWSLGSTSMTFDWLVMRGQPAIIIETPLCSCDPHEGSNHRVRDRWLAVGFTPLSRKLWIGLLTVSGCRRSDCSQRDHTLLMLILAVVGLGTTLVLRLLGY